MTEPFLIPRKKPKLISLIIPCFNEESVIPFLRARLEGFLPGLKIPVEVILVNDGSRDRTVSLLYEWCMQDSRIKIVDFSRNFGHQLAVTAGMDLAKGDVAVIMDADLQDPPEVIPEMIERYMEGYDVVYGQRLERAGETWFKRQTAYLFYRVMRSLVHKDLPLDTGDFRLISRRCLDSLKQLRENNRFLRGMNAWVGYPQIPVQYKRASRVAGETKYPLRKMLRLAMNAAVSFSPFPLRLSLALGSLIAFLGFCVGLNASILAIRHYIFHHDVIYNPGWATIVTLLCLIGGFILIAIGILGEYIARIFEETKARPLYIIKDIYSKNSK
jgi:dolichol-phosphate mannosyltransferase